jgi:hypothetical protein
MSSPKSADVLRAAIADLPPSAYLADRDEKLNSLRHQVSDLVDELKATGMAPEHVMLAVKGVAFDAVMGPFSTGLVEKMVRWSLEEYFKE